MTTTGECIRQFVSGKTMAVVGVSAGGSGFGNFAYTELKKRGYKVLPVHPVASAIQGDPCWRTMAELPERVERALVVVKPDRSEAVVREAAGAGIRQVWLQQGAGSPAALRACEELGLDAVDGQCILMFAEPVGSFHAFHRWIWKLVGKIPR
jgi:predicted CoA-binding protein